MKYRFVVTPKTNVLTNIVPKIFAVFLPVNSGVGCSAASVTEIVSDGNDSASMESLVVDEVHSIELEVQVSADLT